MAPLGIVIVEGILRFKSSAGADGSGKNGTSNQADIMDTMLHIMNGNKQVCFCCTTLIKLTSSNVSSVCPHAVEFQYDARTMGKRCRLSGVGTGTSSTTRGVRSNNIRTNVLLFFDFFLLLLFRRVLVLGASLINRSESY